MWPWILNPLIALLKPRGNATLPIIDLDSKAVRSADKKHIRPLPNAKDTLRVSAWNLYHAAKKAEFLSAFTRADATRAAWHFADEHHSMFRWNNEELRLSPGATLKYETDSHNYRATRIGEGLLLLTMQTLGYAFWDRLDMLMARAARQNARHDQSTRLLKALAKRSGTRPDFVLESKTDTAAAEAKGSLVCPGATSDIKGDLRGALIQLDAAKTLVSPAPSRSYAVAAYLREVDDDTAEGSLIAMADPKGGRSGSSAMELPKDWVRRGNYGAWLVAMGFQDAGNALRLGLRREVCPLRLPVKHVAGRDYAFVVDAPLFHREPATESVRHVLGIGLLWPEDLIRQPDRIEFSILGLRTDILTAISQTLKAPDNPTLLGIELQPNAETGSLDGSILLDGSLAGSITAETLLRLRDADYTEFEL